MAVKDNEITASPATQNFTKYGSTFDICSIFLFNPVKMCLEHGRYADPVGSESSGIK